MKKRKFEGRGKSSAGGNFPSKFARATVSQPLKSTGFKRTEGNATGQSGRQTGVSYFSQPRPPLPDCKSCGKKHAGIYNLRTVTCHKCGKPGHYASACPQSNLKCFQYGKTSHMRKDCPTITPVGSRISVAASNKPVAARTFNMTVKDAVGNPDVIAGTLLLNSVRANVLFDSGATRSFISREFACKLNLQAE